MTLTFSSISLAASLQGRVLPHREAKIYRLVPYRVYLALVLDSIVLRFLDFASMSVVCKLRACKQFYASCNHSLRWI
jgi:hypothetical protein